MLVNINLYIFGQELVPHFCISELTKKCALENFFEGIGIDMLYAFVDICLRYVDFSSRCP